MTWLIVLPSYLILGILIYLWSAHVYQKKIGEVPQYFYHPLVIILVVITWPVLLIKSASRSFKG